MDFNIVLPAVIILVILVGLIIMATLSRKAPWKEDVRKKLRELEELKNNDNEAVLKTLVIEADKLLDHSMKSRGVRGNTMGERLKAAKMLFDKRQYNDIWEAHKVRNKLAHEMNYKLSQRDATDNYKKLRNAISKLL